MTEIVRESAQGESVVLPTGARIGTGDLVRLHPHVEFGTFDRAMNGRLARVSAIEKDVEGGQHIGVVADRGPELDGGVRHEPEHHFFFAPDEIEPLDFAEEMFGEY